MNIQPLSQELTVNGFQFTLKNFTALNTLELMNIYRLRQSVFVVEQNCPYHDIDDQDLTAWHLFHPTKTTVNGYARILLSPERDSHIGRVAVAASARQNGMGRALMNMAIDVCKTQASDQDIVISAQSYLTNFYRSLGFQTIGQFFLEDDIPHQLMHLQK